MTRWCVLQQWQGCVDAVEDGEFSAQLVDVTAGDKTASEIVSMHVDHLEESEREFVKLGSIFDWRIEQNDAGETRSVFEFSREAWSEGDLEAGLREAESILRDLKWE